MNSELEVLRDVLARLEGGAIPHMLTGSVAMSVDILLRKWMDAGYDT